MTIRIRLCIQPVATSWRMPASMNGKPVVPVAQRSNRCVAAASVSTGIASNNHGWQWVAGTGTDASPYFRVFNPVTQGLRFDPHGDYVRRYVPELAHLEGKAAHEPWKHPDGYAHGYPERVVDHAEERREALRRYEAARG